MNYGLQKPRFISQVNDRDSENLQKNCYVAVHAIRCNYDGYVAGAGVILAGWYIEPAKIEALLALGDLSQLAEELTACVAYHRDRHEPMRPARQFASVDDYKHLAEGEMSADYLYVYDGGKWLVYGLYNVAEWIRVEVRKDAKIL